MRTYLLGRTLVFSLLISGHFALAQERVFVPSANSVGIMTSGTEHLRVDSTGKVGIGTTAPAYLLDVNGTTRVNSTLTVGGNLRIQNGEANDYISLPLGDDSFRIFLNDNEKFTVLSNGNVGIGATTPTAGLEVNGTMKVFGARSNLSLGSVYGPAATDGFVIVYGRADGATGNIRVSVNADVSNPPTTERMADYAYNNGSYLSGVSLNVPIRKGEYYRILCNGGTTCGGSYFIGGSGMYFVPLGN